MPTIRICFRRLADRGVAAGNREIKLVSTACRRLGLFSEASVAIDGSKFKAVNTRDRNFTQAKMQRRLAQIDERIARYLSQLDSADRQEEAFQLSHRITRINAIHGETPIDHTAMACQLISNCCCGCRLSSIKSIMKDVLSAGARYTG
jgi:hypothetical protein